MKKILSFLTLAMITQLLSLSATNVHAQENTYLLGVVPQFHSTRLGQTWQPILDYLKQDTGFTIILKLSPTIPDFEHDLKQGDFDFAYMNPYHMMLANRDNGYHPLVKDIGKNLHGVLVVKKNGPITDITQLKDKTIAFPAPNALGASLQMRQEMHDNFDLKIIPKYVGTHDSVYLNILLGDVAAGGGVQKTLSRQQPVYRGALKVIYKTKGVAPHPIAAHPRVSKEMINIIKTSLLKLGKTISGRLLLSKIPMKEIGTATMADYYPLADMRLERFYLNKK